MADAKLDFTIGVGTPLILRADKMYGKLFLLERIQESLRKQSIAETTEEGHEAVLNFTLVQRA